MLECKYGDDDKLRVTISSFPNDTSRDHQKSEYSTRVLVLRGHGSERDQLEQANPALESCRVGIRFQLGRKHEGPSAIYSTSHDFADLTRTYAQLGRRQRCRWAAE